MIFYSTVILINWFMQIMSWFIGEFTASSILIYAIIHILQISLCLYIAYKSFMTQNRYSIWTHTISFLGSRDANRNPRYWWIFSITMIWTGLMFLPTMQFLFHKLVVISLIGGWVFEILAWMGSIGLILIAFLPSDEPPRPFPPKKTIGQWHDVVAISAIICLFLSVICMGIILLLPDDTPFILSLGYYIVIGLLCIGIPIQIKWQIMCKQNRKLKPFPGDGIYSLPFWEWILFGILYFIIYWSAIFIS